ncbi:DNA polymerase ligase N-terminal domain-containing protein [Amycolatopsis thermophila]|uniref:Bifunctional non-homologous end joining protein LigD n=1 Tax=Amycolatopsis thermophila TaxID=206084 RepID=A0ABU0EXM9_9PSEU|nr:DNA polymerase ligase N-terminal domain-containing protein [Amycolatopsis thermophila]MDQ0380089.1 bifunctional non-homologous end joining protein LigD [Amycolatopsis thermophila]
MADLSEYRRKRDPERTPEPMPDRVVPRGDDDVFVIQEHHARRLHWDVRFERDGVLVSWAVPKGLPPRPGPPRLAVHTEDHPLEYATFEGEIPKGEYGGGKMLIWDRGTYEVLHWNDHKVEVDLRGSRVRGRFLFVNSHRGSQSRDWLVRRVDRGSGEELPEFVKPMQARAGSLPSEDAGWAYEFRWRGERVVVRVEGGRITVRDHTGEDVTPLYPELRGLGESLGATEVLLDGELIVLEDGRPSRKALRTRVSAEPRQAKRLSERSPVLFLPFDVLHADGKSLLQLPYRKRRARLRKLQVAGDYWRTPESYDGGGADVLAASLANGLGGVTAKRLDSVYEPGKRSGAWLTITK